VRRRASSGREPAPIVVAVDGGGSKTDAVALGAGGVLLGRARAAGSSPQILGLDGAIAVIDGLMADLLAQLDHVPGGVRIDGVHAYLSGLDLPEEVTAFRAGIADRPWIPADPASVVVDNDLFALLRAGTDESDAAAVVCGTGINAVGVRSDGATVRFAALGNYTGDWGGGWQLGEQALWHAARAVDGRGPDTALVRGIPPVYGLETLDDVVRALHFGRLPMEAMSAICPAVFAASTDGDAVARSLVDRQADEIVTLAATTLRRLDLLRADVPLVLGGGVIAGRDPRLLAGIRAGLDERAPHARTIVVDDPPVVGAALLAATAVGAGADALTRLRDDLCPERVPLG
jgi:N-acetylglucosamine kinase-like BadF-type ATPase